MKRIVSLISYSFLAAAILILDQLTKWYALENIRIPQIVTNFLSFELAFNRGISWGLLHSASNCLFGLVTLIVAGITFFIGVLAWQRFKEGRCIVGEIRLLRQKIPAGS